MLNCKYCNNNLKSLGDDKFLCEDCQKEFIIKLSNENVSKINEYQVYITYNYSEASMKLGQELYENLGRKFKVFYAPLMTRLPNQSINIEDIINLALTQSKIMIVLCDSIMNTNSEILKSEVSKFMGYGNKIIIPIIMSNYDFNDLPDYLNYQAFYQNEFLFSILEKHITSMLYNRKIIQENIISVKDIVSGVITRVENGKEILLENQLSQDETLILAEQELMNLNTNKAKEILMESENKQGKFLLALLENDTDKAMTLLDNIKDLEDKTNCRLKGEYYRLLNTKQSIDNAISLLSRCYDDVLAMKALSEIYLERKDYTKALDTIAKLNTHNQTLGSLEFYYYYNDRNNPLNNRLLAVDNLVNLINQNIDKTELICKLAEYYTNGYVVEQDYKKAYELFSQAYEKGDFNAGLMVAKMKMEGTGVAKNDSEAKEIIDNLIDLGFNKAIAFYADILINKFLYKTGYEYLKNGVEIENIDAIFTLGMFMSRGVGTQKNIKQGMELVYKAAKNNHIVAQYELANYYYSIRRFELFEKWIIKAINNNSFDACKLLIKAIKEKRTEIKSKYVLDKLMTIYYNTDQDVVDCIIKESFNFKAYDIAIKFSEIEKQYENSLAYLTLGHCAYEGYGMTRSTFDAYEYFLTGAKLNNSECQYYTYVCLMELKNMSNLEEDPIKWLKKSAENGFPKAQVKLAEYYEEREDADTLQNNFEACRWLKRAAEAGEPEGQFLLGMCYYYGREGGVMKSQKEAMKWLTLAAEQHHPQAEYTLGYCWYYADGIIQQQDKREAVKWFKKAAENNVTEAMIELSNCYFTQSGTSYNPTRAIEYLEKASKLDNAEANYLLGMCYMDGKGVEKDFTKAINHLRKAENKDFIKAVYKLANCYQTGVGVIKNANEAVRLYEKAIELGSIESIYSLALMHYNGDGIIKNHYKAKEFLDMAAERDYQPAIDFLKKKF